MKASRRHSNPTRQTLVDVVDETTRMRPNHTALIFKDERISYGELTQQSDALARAKSI
jgi:non-ribosomal peptide synthetase component E (peptide arylation enzyme)